MKFYEFKKPYYALVKAEGEESAKSVYEDVVGEQGVYFSELEKEEAFKKFFEGLIKFEGIIEEIVKEGLEEWNNDDEIVLLIDGELL